MTNEEKQEIIKEIFLKYIEDYFEEWCELVKSRVQEIIEDSTKDLTTTQREFYNWFENTRTYDLLNVYPNHHRGGDLYSELIEMTSRMRLNIDVFLRWFEKDIDTAIAKAEKTAKK